MPSAWPRSINEVMSGIDLIVRSTRVRGLFQALHVDPGDRIPVIEVLVAEADKRLCCRALIEFRPHDCGVDLAFCKGVQCLDQTSAFRKITVQCAAGNVGGISNLTERCSRVL